MIYNLFLKRRSIFQTSLNEADITGLLDHLTLPTLLNKNHQHYCIKIEISKTGKYRESDHLVFFIGVVSKTKILTSIHMC